MMDTPLRVDVGTDDFQGVFGTRARRVPVNHAEAARKAEHERDVFGNRHPLDQTKILVDECDGQATQRVGHVAAAVGHCAGVERMDTGEYLDQRRFARPVLAQERHDLARADVDPRVDECLRAAKVLGHAAHRQERLAGPRRNVAIARQAADLARARRFGGCHGEVR